MSVTRLLRHTSVLRTFTTSRSVAVDPSVYAPDTHKWDVEDADKLLERRWGNVSVPEGGPRISTPEHPRISRHSLLEPSYGHSLRDPPYQYQHTSMRWDMGADALRLDRFPRNVSVVEGGPYVSTADFPSIVRHSLLEPGYSVREPYYPFQH